MYKNAGACPNPLNWPDKMKLFHYLKKPLSSKVKKKNVQT
jgi:hypothetical protein